MNYCTNNFDSIEESAKAICTLLKRGETAILHLLSSGRPFYYTDPTGKIYALKDFLTKES